MISHSGLTDLLLSLVALLVAFSILGERTISRSQGIPRSLSLGVDTGFLHHEQSLDVRPPLSRAKARHLVSLGPFGGML
ncbi:MAG TPA: hypothetical protein PKV83_01665 [Methanothrix sp.]|nr:hypothetical protein [Methanothrix sp.]HOV51620.1 hypothetical protein [Methanothrix sp.]